MSEATVNPGVRDKQRVAVYLKAAWADAWVEYTDMEPVSATCNAAPGISQARLLFRYGSIKYATATAFADVAALDLRGWFVKLAVGPAMSEAAIFYGYIPAEELQTFSGKGTVEAGDYTVTAFGLEYLLDQKRIYQSIASLGYETASAATISVINRVIPFNGRESRGLNGFGNRSDAQETLPSTESAYVFSSEGSVWTAGNIAEYILKALPVSDVLFELAGQTTALDSYAPVALDPTGMTPRGLLNAVIDRRRGVSWSIRVVPDGGGPPGAEKAQIHIATTVGADVVEGGVTLPANTEQQAIALDGEPDVADLEIRTETATQYGWVYVRGAPLVSVFTVSHTGGSLAPLWAAADQTAYDSANDEQRTGDGFRPVYRTFQIPRDFDFSGLNPYVDVDGTVDPLTDAAMRRWGRKLQRELPIAEPWDLDDAFVEYRSPFAVVESPLTPGKYIYLDRLDAVDQANVELRVLDGEAGVELTAPYNHQLGLNHFAGTSEKEPVIDWQAVQVTVAMETDQHLRYIAQISGASEPDRVLLIEVPDAQLWWIADQTVLDIEVNGDLLLQSGNAVLRSDLDRLKGIAALAKAWYGQARSTLTLRRKVLTTAYAVGNYITTVTTADLVEPVQSMVTQVSHNLRAHETTVVTGYEELDAGAIG